MRFDSIYELEEEHSIYNKYINSVGKKNEK